MTYKFGKLQSATDIVQVLGWAQDTEKKVLSCEVHAAPRKNKVKEL